MRNVLLDKYLAGVMKLVNIGDLKGPDANFVTLPLGHLRQVTARV